MNTATAGNDRVESVLPEVIEKLSHDPLCLEVRHYPADNELAGDEKLHLLAIMERELKQSERRSRVEEIDAIAGRYGLKADIIFSSPKVWRDLKKLVSPFTRIERESTIDWQRS